MEDGQKCASACALIFLAGNAPAHAGAWPQRFLHPRGRLLFHSSRIDLDRRFKDDTELLDYLTTQSFDDTGLKERIAELYQDGLRDEENVLDTFRNFAYEREGRRDPWVRPSLFLQMFSQDWNEWVCVDTIDAVGRWNIQVFGYSPPKSPAQKNYLKVCHNAYNWRQDRFVADGEIEGDDEAGNRDAQVTEPPPTTRFAGRNKSTL